MAMPERLETHTRLDTLIRDHLTAQPDGVAHSAQVLRAVMQRAQTEVVQLPATDTPPAAQNESPVMPPSALLHREPLPVTNRAPRRNSADAMLHYRELMDLKMLWFIGGTVSQLKLSR